MTATDFFDLQSPRDLDQRAKVFSALSDPTRLQIVDLLSQEGELSGSAVAQQVGISLSLFCHHSKTLSEAGLVAVRKSGQTKYLSINWAVLNHCLDSFRPAVAP